MRDRHKWFFSVFDQLLTETEVQFLIDALHTIGESRLANEFNRTYLLLKNTAFFQNKTVMCIDLNIEVQEKLTQLEKTIRKGDILWALDKKLLGLISTDHT